MVFPYTLNIFMLWLCLLRVRAFCEFSDAALRRTAVFMSENLEDWIICYNFAADLVRKGSSKLWHEAMRLTEKPV